MRSHKTRGLLLLQWMLGIRCTIWSTKRTKMLIVRNRILMSFYPLEGQSFEIQIRSIWFAN